jgi:hypothetical protein
MTVWRCLVLAAVACVVGSACASSSAERGANQPPDSVPPGTPYLWLSSPVVPPSGGPLAVAVMNPTDTGLSYGVIGSFEHWNGNAWVSAGSWTGSLDQWGRFGGVSHNTSGIVPAIGLGAGAQAVGTVEYTNLPSLTPGWYRLGVGNAYGVVGVVPGAATPVLTNPPTLTVYPELVAPTGGVLGLDGFPPTNGVQTLAQVNQFNDQLSPTVDLQRLEGTTWVPVAALTAAKPPPPYIEHPAGVAVTVPVLAAGAYRLVRRSPTAGDLVRQFWVINPPAGVNLTPSK